MTIRIRMSALVLSFAAAISACAISPSKDRDTVSKGVDTAVNETNAGLEDAVLSPATDLNLRRAQIPRILRELNTVYSPTRDWTCDMVRSEVEGLDEVLGPDADAPSEDASDSEKVGRGAANATLDVISGTTSGVIPFRGLVRLATGASAHERRIRAAYLKGLQRRSYLKGVGQNLECEPPAAPLPPEEKEPTIIYRSRTGDSEADEE